MDERDCVDFGQLCIFDVDLCCFILRSRSQVLRRYGVPKQVSRVGTVKSSGARFRRFYLLRDFEFEADHLVLDDSIRNIQWQDF